MFEDLQSHSLELKAQRGWPVTNSEHWGHIKLKALIFEDEIIIAEALKNSLLDFTEIKKVEISQSLDQLKRNLEKETYDIAFLDVNIRGQPEGIIAGQLIRSHSYTPIIYLTAYSDDEVIKEISKNNPDAYLLKPFNDIQIIATTKQVLLKNNSNNSFGSIEIPDQNGTQKLPKFEIFQSLFDEVFLVSISNIDGDILYVNQEFAKMNGYEPAEMLGKNHRILCSGYHSKEFFENLWNTVLRKDIWIGDIKNQRKDGSYYWVKSYIFQIQPKSPQANTYLVSLRVDITKLKEHEIDLENLVKEKIVELSNNRQDTSMIWKEESLSKFNSIFVHELKKPLAILSLQLDQLLKRHSETLPVILIQGLQRTRTNLTHTSQLINYLNETFRRKPTDTKEQIPLIGLLDSVVTFTKTLFSTEIINIELRITQQEIKILGFTDAVFLAVFNILKNACESFKREQENKLITLELEDHSDLIYLNIIDNISGGIDESIIKGLFSVKTSKKDGGSGLGLYLTRSFLEAMGASINLKYSDQNGSCFQLTLPKA